MIPHIQNYPFPTALPSRISAYHPLYPPIILHVTTPPPFTSITSQYPLTGILLTVFSYNLVIPYSGTMHPLLFIAALLPFIGTTHPISSLQSSHMTLSLLILGLCTLGFTQTLLFYWDYAPAFMIMQPRYCLFSGLCTLLTGLHNLALDIMCPLVITYPETLYNHVFDPSRNYASPC